ncbi:hypothetical protein COPG_00026 [Colwellia phage 9A]|uniref:Uncharacterized protein n=1 Tax=Colwellia phage 9A TaxID=765765 RepID=I3UMA7_9CAUD|nr:hypothetical protein COPG_00026 [Colwellia phage 9A]AFK66622.1 hypothetical protein COPG_00026 [Colwellia phage 9A]
MRLDQKLPNSQWIAHDATTSDVLPLTLRSGLMECKAAYIKEALLNDLNDIHCYVGHQRDPNSCEKEYLLSRFEDEIPCNIEFVIVTLQPRYETTVKGAN